MSTPYQINFPDALDDYTSLGGYVTPHANTRLIVALGETDTSAIVSSTSSFGPSGKFSLNGEIVYFGDKTATTLTGLLRGRENTRARAHPEGSRLTDLITTSDHTILVDAIIATQRAVAFPSGIPATAIADGSVDNDEFQALDGVTSSIQSQLDDKSAIGHTHPASDIVSGAMALARGGTAANLSTTGGAGQYLKQSSSGAVVTVGVISASDLPSGIDAAKIGAGSVSNTEFGYLDGTTSSLQAQLDGKAATSHTHAAADIVSGLLALARGGAGADLSVTGGTGQVLKQTTSGGAITVAALLASEMPSGIDAAKIGTGAVSNTEFGYLDGVTSAIQTQLDSKSSGVHVHSAADITSGILALARGGTAADLSATGGAGQYVKQASSGGALTVGTIAAGDIPSGIDASKIGTGGVTNTEFGYLDGVTSSIQTQLDSKSTGVHVHSAADITSGILALARGGTGSDLSATGGTGQLVKQSSSGGAFTVAALSASEVPSGIDAAKIGTGAVSSAEYGYLDGVTSSIQTQLDSKSSGAHTHPASEIVSGILTLARGGTAADLSGTGGAGQYLKQSSSGAVVTVGVISASDLPSGIDAVKIGAGSVSNTEFGYLNGVTSSIQTQLDSKADGGSGISALTGDVTASGSGSVAATIPANTINQSKMADNSIGTAELIDANVTDAKLAVAYLKQDGSRALTGNQSAGGFKITSVATPAAGTDAVNKSYVDIATISRTQKDNVRVASTSSVTISSAPSAIDGVTLSTSDRILLKDQTSGAQNGIYDFNGAGSALTRSTDANSSTEVIAGILVVATEGTTNADTGWILATDGTIALGTTPLAFAPFGVGSRVTPTTPSLTNVRLASTDNVILPSPIAAIDGVTLTAIYERSHITYILLKNQASPPENGIYSWDPDTQLLFRVPNFSASGSYQSGLLVAVSEGMTQADSIWMLTTDGTIVVGTTALAFSRTPILPNGFVTDAQLVTSYLKTDGSRALTGNQSAGGFKITNGGSPAAGSDIATKSYVDYITLAGQNQKDPVRVASTANVTVSSAPSAIDGVTLSLNDRVLLKNQTVGSQNGIYDFNGAASALTRSADAAVSAEVLAGMLVIVAEGSTNHDTSWLLTTDNPITLGTTSLAFTAFGGGAGVLAPTRPLITTVGLVATSNVTLGASSVVIDGFTPYAHTRVLLVGQADETQNGIYESLGTGGPFARASDFFTSGTYAPGLLVVAMYGLSQGKSVWMLQDPVEIRTEVPLYGFVGYVIYSTRLPFRPFSPQRLRTLHNDVGLPHNSASYTELSEFTMHLSPYTHYQIKAQLAVVLDPSTNAGLRVRLSGTAGMSSVTVRAQMQDFTGFNVYGGDFWTSTTLAANELILTPSSAQFAWFQIDGSVDTSTGGTLNIDVAQGQPINVATIIRRCSYRTYGAETF